MSITTSLPQTQPKSAQFRRQRRRARFSRRGFVSAGLVVIVVLTGAGAYLAYQNTLPTSFKTNYKNGQKDVPTDGRIALNFSRPVATAAVETAFSINPTVTGTISPASGQTQFVWSPVKPLAELTTYTVSMKSIIDVGHHRSPATSWSFTTIIVPHVISITDASGMSVADGMEIDPGTSLKLTFNDAMEPATVKVTLGASQVADLRWAADDRSATLSTSGIPSGPLQVVLAAGAQDQTRHYVPGAVTLKTGLYYHDREHATALKFPALIQIPNDEFARDQNGLQAADMVWEYLAEGGITRLTAMFDNAPDLIGPMRSARFISLKLGRHYDGLLFQSGESQATAARAEADPTPQFFDTAGYQFRTGARIAPDNLMIRGPSVKAAEDNFFSKLPAFVIPKSRPLLTGGTVATTVNVAEHYSVYTYDPAMGTYQKTEEGHRYQDASLRQPLRIEMLIVLHTQEQLLNVGDGHGAHIHDYDLDTRGAIQVYYKGLGYTGTWTSTNSHGPLAFTLGNGQPLSLPPGLVWVDVTA